MAEIGYSSNWVLPQGYAIAVVDEDCYRFGNDNRVEKHSMYKAILPNGDFELFYPSSKSAYPQDTAKFWLWMKDQTGGIRNKH